MKLCCKRCNAAAVFEIPEFSLETKKKLATLHLKSPLLAIQEMLKHRISHKQGKFITAHLNLKVNVCHRCETTLDEEECISCPKCNSLNFNWNLSS